MYEEISIKKRIDWKSLIIKIGILLIIVFIICAIALSPKKSYAVTPLNNITKKLLNAGKDYYVYEKLPTKIGEAKTISLTTLIEEEYIKEKAYKDNKCKYDESYVKITKVNTKEFSIFATVNCQKGKDIIVDTIKTKNDNSNNEFEDNFTIEVIE